MFIVMVGNPVDGFEFVGPFEDHDEAVEWAEKKLRKGDEPWWIIPLQKPE